VPAQAEAEAEAEVEVAGDLDDTLVDELPDVDLTGVEIPDADPAQGADAAGKRAPVRRKAPAPRKPGPAVGKARPEDEPEAEEE
jgi:hypothetical protein